MEIRKFKIVSEDEARLRELMRIQEAEIDRLTDEELEAAERQNSEQIFRLLGKNKVVRFRAPVKSSAVAFLAAAAALLFVNVQQQNQVPPSQVVSKGTVEALPFACEPTIVTDSGSASIKDGAYPVKAGTTTYLKLSHCSEKPVFVHIGYLQGEMLHLSYSNLSIANSENLVMQGQIRLNVMEEWQKHPGLIVVVTDQALNGSDLSPKDRAGLWLDEIPLKPVD